MEWTQPVPGAPLPADDSAGAWVAFGDAQTGQLEKANDRSAAKDKIVEACEKRDAAIKAALKPKHWWSR